MAWDQPGQYVCSQDSTRSKGLSMAVLRDSCSGNLLRLFRSERELHEISEGHDPGVPPNCPSRSKSLSSLTMKSDFARSAHSRIRLSSGSSLMTLSLAVGITRFVSLANLPRESCSISPPTTRTCRATHAWFRPEWCRKCRGCRRWNQWWRRSPRALLVSRLSDQAVNVCFRVYPERLRPLPTISHEPQPRAVFQILLDGLFQQFGRLPSLGARSIFQLFCQFAGKRQVVVDMASSVLLSHVSEPTLSPVVGRNVSRCGVWLCVGGLLQSCPLPVVQLAVRTLPVGARFASRL